MPRIHQRRSTVTRVLLGLLVLSLPPHMAAADSADLSAEIERLAKTENVVPGVAAIHLPSGRSFAVNGDRRFPLASTYKVAMAAYAFHLVEQDRLNKEQMISVNRRDYVPSSRITEAFPHHGVQLSLLNLVEPMMIYSDNTATDAVYRQIGGGSAVTAWLRAQGIEGLRVDRPTVELLRDYFDVETPEDPDTSLVDQVEAWKASGAEEDGPEETRARFQRLLNDPRDQGTPMAMASLLRDLWKGELLSAEHTALLKEIMRRCRTGSTRLSGGLPDHVLPIAHKTGTLGGSVNDVGVVALPDGGDLVIAVFVQGDAAEISRSSLIGARAIAQITRAVYDYFLLAAD